MLAALALAALVAAGVVAGRSGRGGALLLAATSLIWLLANKPMEGRTLVVLTDTRGITAADLAGLTGLLLAAILLIFPRRG